MVDPKKTDLSESIGVVAPALCIMMVQYQVLVLAMVRVLVPVLVLLVQSLVLVPGTVTR